MSSTFSFKERMQYKFDSMISSGPLAIIKLLALVSVVLIVVFGAIIALTQVAQPEQAGLGFGEALRQTLMHTIDAGTVAGDAGRLFRLVMILVTIGGIFIVSMLIGILTSGLEGKVADLRRGRSKVLETNHILLLGWSQKIDSVLSELIIANEGKSQQKIVILSTRDKVDMEDEIFAKVPHVSHTKIICRSGDPLDLVDLEMVNPRGAQSIIVFSPEEENPDTYVIKTVMAITNQSDTQEASYHIVAEILDAKNMAAAELVGAGRTAFVQPSDLIAKITAQTCRQSGLSVVYTELLDFGGDEIYFVPVPVGCTVFKDALFAHENATVLGFLRAHDNQVVLNPSLDTHLSSEDKIIVIAADDLHIHISSEKASIVSDAICTQSLVHQPQQEKILLLGWNAKGAPIIRSLDQYVTTGSTVLVVTDTDMFASEITSLQQTLTHISLEYIQGDTTDANVLQSCNLSTFDHIIVLCMPNLPIQVADTKTLITLLHLRNFAKESGTHLNIVSEMLDVKNRDLAVVTKADDFIVSDRLVSLFLTQLAKNKHLQNVFSDLFQAKGSEIYIKPMEDYIIPGKEITFSTLIEAATKKGELALGYRSIADSNDATKSYGIVLNPCKSAKFTLQKGDKVIVLAEE